MPTRYSHPRNILVDTLRRLYDLGMTTTSGGNLSIRDDDGDIWITPGGLDKGTLRPEDIVRVAADGTVDGRHRPSCELPFHRAVYSLRADVCAVLHAHSPALVAFSLVGRIPDADLVPGCRAAVGRTAFAPYEIPGSEKLGRIVAQSFAEGADAVIMENHGAVMAGRDIPQAFARFEALDYVARMQINAAGLGPTRPLDGQQRPTAWPEFTTGRVTPAECERRDEIAAFRGRAYRQRLLFSGHALLSARLGDDDFLVTPAGFDPMHLDAHEVVRMRRGERESGKIPSSAAAFCRAAYARHPWVNALMMTRPPNAMAFAVTGTKMDSRTIPESFIMLRDVPPTPSREYFDTPERTLERLSPSTPVLMIENTGVLTTGRTLLEAFDRLEVAEFTAKCVLMAGRIGALRPIGDAQVADIVREFALPPAPR